MDPPVVDHRLPVSRFAMYRYAIDRSDTRQGARRAFAAALMLALVLPAVAGEAQAPPAPDDNAPLALHAYTLRYRQVEDAELLVRRMLSPVGSVQVQAERDTVVVRDTAASLARIAPALRDFDRPLRPLQLEMMVVRALRSTGTPLPPTTVPKDLADRLSKLLSYDVYQLVARADLPTQENEDVTYEVGAGYSVRFQVGEVLAGGQVKLRDFRLFQRGGREPMIRTHLNLFLGKTYTLGLAKSEESPTALMVVIVCNDRDAVNVAPPAAVLGGGG